MAIADAAGNISSQSYAGQADPFVSFDVAGSPLADNELRPSEYLNSGMDIKGSAKAGTSIVITSSDGKPVSIEDANIQRLDGKDYSVISVGENGQWSAHISAQSIKALGLGQKGFRAYVLGADESDFANSTAKAELSFDIKSYSPAISGFYDSTSSSAAISGSSANRQPVVKGDGAEPNQDVKIYYIEVDESGNAKTDASVKYAGEVSSAATGFEKYEESAGNEYGLNLKTFIFGSDFIKKSYADMQKDIANTKDYETWLRSVDLNLNVNTKAANLKQYYEKGVQQNNNTTNNPAATKNGGASQGPIAPFYNRGPEKNQEAKGDVVAMKIEGVFGLKQAGLSKVNEATKLVGIKIDNSLAGTKDSKAKIIMEISSLDKEETKAKTWSGELR